MAGQYPARDSQFVYIIFILERKQFIKSSHFWVNIILDQLLAVSQLNILNMKGERLMKIKSGLIERDRKEAGRYRVTNRYWTANMLTKEEDMVISRFMDNIILEYSKLGNSRYLGYESAVRHPHS